MKEECGGVEKKGKRRIMVGSVGDWRRGLPLRVERHPFSDNSVQMEGFFNPTKSHSISIISKYSNYLSLIASQTGHGNRLDNRNRQP